MGERLDFVVCSCERDAEPMSNDWAAYSGHYKDVAELVRERIGAHGFSTQETDAKIAMGKLLLVIDDLGLRLARSRAGIDETAEYGS